MLNLAWVKRHAKKARDQAADATDTEDVWIAKEL